MTHARTLLLPTGMAMILAVRPARGTQEGPDLDILALDPPTETPAPDETQKPA